VKPKYVKLSGCVGGVLLFGLTGCAFTSGVVKLNYQTPIGLPHGQGDLAVGKIADERGREPCLLMNKINAYGQKTSGAYLAEKPIAEIIEDSVRRGLSSAGYRVDNPDAPKLLNGRVMTLDFEPIMGMFTTTLNAKIVVEFTLMDRQTQQPVWKEIVTGLGSQKSGSIFGEDYIRPAFKQAMDDLLRKLIGSDSFKAALR
jgi:hypothetical protein